MNLRLEIMEAILNHCKRNNIHCNDCSEFFEQKRCLLVNKVENIVISKGGET